LFDGISIRDLSQKYQRLAACRREKRERDENPGRLILLSSSKVEKRSEALLYLPVYTFRTGT
jgi:hypothetical protein